MCVLCPLPGKGGMFAAWKEANALSRPQSWQGQLFWHPRYKEGEIKFFRGYNTGALRGVPAEGGASETMLFRLRPGGKLSPF